MPPDQQMTPQMMQMLQQMQQPPQGQANMPQLSPGAAGAMGMPQPPPGGGFLGAAQAAQPGVMPPAGDMPPQGGVPPRMPPPGSQPQGMPPQGMGMQPQSMQGMPPQMQGQMLQMIQGMPPEAKQMLIQHLTASLAGSGRGGDTTIAHLTPGEMTVPPQVQTPKVLATLNKAFKDKGAAAHQFTVGSPTQSVNPATGLPEYGFFNSGFMKAALPIALGVGGSMLLPGIGTALAAGSTGALAGAGGAAAADAAAAGTAGGALAGGAAGAAAPSLALSSLGSGLGTTAGGLLTGQSPGKAIGSGIGAGVGGYALGNISNGMTAMGNPTGSPASTSIFGGTTAAVPPSTPWAGNSVTSPIGNINPYQMLGSAGGSAAGGFLGAAMDKKPAQGPQLPNGFNNHYTPGVGSPRDQLGQTSYTGAVPNFNGYNPATNFPSAFNFYPNRS